jgi:glycosyltransferase involved in cell wall biosynthesis
MKQNKKIVLLVPGYPDDEADTSSVTYLQDLLHSYEKFYPGRDPQVITFQFPYQEGDYKRRKIGFYNAAGKNRRGIWKFLTWNRVLRKLEQINKGPGIHVVHSFWLGECTFIAQRFCKKHGIKHVASILGRDVLNVNKYLERLDLSRIQVVAISKALAARYKVRSGKEVNAVIPFGLNVEKLVLAQFDRTIDIVGVGSLIPLKNYSLFMEVVHELKKEIPGITASIIGSGEELEMLIAKIRVLDLHSNIVLRGGLGHREVFGLMQQSRVFLHTSSYEGQSLVMMEALYAGLPVVCFDTGRPYEGDRLKVCSDKQEMVAAVKQFLTERTNYDPVLVQTTEQTAKKYFELYDH